MESLVLFAASFYITWVLFAAVYYVICYANGDFEAIIKKQGTSGLPEVHDNINGTQNCMPKKDDNHTFCILEIENFGENR